MSRPARTPAAERVAREYERIEERVRDWAAASDEVRAAVVLGSRTRGDHAADEFADLDVIVVIADDARPFEDPAWLHAIGEPWISFVERKADGSSPELRVLFAGGYDVDLAFIGASQAGRLVDDDPDTAATAFGRGHRILVDKDGLAARMVRAASHSPAPSGTSVDGADFRWVCAHFWYHAVWTAKHLRRGELWWAKSCCDGLLKDHLRRVLEWQAAAEGRDPWFRGRFLDEWADPDVVAGLRKAIARYDAEEVWASLQVTMDLFAQTARPTAAVLGLPYDAAAESHARELVLRMRTTGSFVE